MTQQPDTVVIPTEFTLTASAVQIFSIDFGLILPGASETKAITVKNQSGATITTPRFFMRRSDGLYTKPTAEDSDDANLKGQEMLDEKWMEVREPPGAFKPIGGDFGNQGVAANYLILSSIADAATLALEVKLNLPTGIDTSGLATWQIGLAWSP